MPEKFIESRETFIFQFVGQARLPMRHEPGSTSMDPWAVSSTGTEVDTSNFSLVDTFVNRCRGDHWSPTMLRIRIGLLEIENQYRRAINDRPYESEKRLNSRCRGRPPGRPGTKFDLDGQILRMIAANINDFVPSRSKIIPGCRGRHPLH